MNNHTFFIRVLIAFLFCFTHSHLSGQSPQGINYQAVARDGSDLLTNQNLTLRLSIIETGTTIYQETHSTSTNGYGLFTAIIGKGNPSLGVFSNIEWNLPSYELQVEMDTGSGFSDMGTTSFQSVPFSLYAEKAGSVENLSLSDLTDTDLTTPANGDVLRWNGSSWTPDADEVNDPDNDPTNEIQTISLSGTRLSLSNGGGSVNLPTGTTYTAGPGIELSNDIITNTGDTDPADDITIGTPANGDVSGIFSNLSVDKIKGKAVSSTPPASGQVLKWNGSSWSPSTDLSNSPVWSTSGTSAYYNTGKVGIGTSSPSDFVQIDAASLTDAFRVRIGGSTKFRVNSNGSITVGTLGAGPDNGMYIAGNVGVGTSAPSGRFQVIPLGNINQSSTIDATKAGLIIGSASSGIIMDANQIESQGSTLNLNFNSNRNISMVEGGGKIAIGHSSPSARLDLMDESWQFRIQNPGNGGDDWYIGGSNAGWAVGRRKFIISPNSSSNSAVFSIDSVGRVGIGTPSPATKLNVLGGNDVAVSGGGYLALGSLSSANIGIDNNEIMARNNGSFSTLFLNADGGKISLRTLGGNSTHDVNMTGSIKLYLGGTEDWIIDKSESGTDPVLYSTDSEYGLVGKNGNEMFNVRSKRFYAETNFNYLAYSDRRIKENIRPIPNPLEKINNIDGVAYDMKKEHYYKSGRDKEEFTRTHQMGFIAQDIEKVLPQLVQVDEETGLKTVGYMGVIPVLVEAVKEQQRLINQQNQLIEELKNRVDMLERKH